MMNTQRKSLPLLSLSLMACLGWTACNKGEGDSKAKDIANFSRDQQANLTLNQCGPDKPSAFVNDTLRKLPAKSKAIVASEASTAVIKSVLSAAPRALVVYYFGTGGTIETRSKLSAADCRLSELEAQYAKEGTGSLKSCWQKQDGKHAVILVEDSESAIRHSLIRSLALVYADIFMKQMAKSSKAEDRSNSVSFKGQMQQLASSYLSLIESKSKDVHSKMLAIQKADSSLFSQMVWAELTDSLYCRRSTFDSIWLHNVNTTVDGKNVAQKNPFRPLADALKEKNMLFFYPASYDGVSGKDGEKNKLDCPWFFKGDEQACKKAFAS